MPHAAHALLILATAILLVGTGIVILALGWRRAYRGERSAMVVGVLSPRQTMVSVAAIPAVGLASVMAIAIVAAALR